MGGKTRTDSAGQMEQGWDHDPPAERKWSPLGILVVATGALALFFGSKETSDFWLDCLKRWWELVHASVLKPMETYTEDLTLYRSLKGWLDVP